MERVPISTEQVIYRFEQLPPERRAEVADFVDFLAQRERERNDTAVIAKLSEPSLERIWNNPDDAEYDKL